MSEHNYEIDLFKPDDAPGVTQLFREVYGDRYPVKIVYNHEELVAAFEKSEYIPVIARTKDNRIVGFTFHYRPAPYKGLYELGQARVSALIMFGTIVRKPHTVYVPQVYEEYCRYVADWEEMQ